MTAPGDSARRRVAGLGDPDLASRRIVLVLHSSLSVPGGAEEVTTRLAAAWRAAGHRVAVLTFDDLPGWVHPRLRRSALPWFLTAWLVAARAGRRLDVLDCSTGDAWLYGLLTKRLRRWALVVRSHGLEPLGERAHQAELRRRGQRPKRLRQLYFAYWMLAEVRCSLRVSDVVRVLSQAEQRYCVDELGLSPSRVLLRPNGFPDELLAQPTSDPDAPLRLATIGRWERLKGSDELPAVLAGFLRALPGSTALLLGTGVSAAQVLADLPADIRARVEVLPSYPSSQVGEHLSGCHLYLSLSHTEGFSLGLVEAMACGLVPVVTAVGAAPDVVTPEAGFVIGVHDTDAAVRSILALAEDRRALARRGEAARTAVGPLCWSAVAQDDLRHLTDL